MGEVELELDGRSIRDAIASLRALYAEEAISSTREQAAALLADVVRVYSNEFGAGEVGRGAAGRASSAIGATGQAPTGLLYGRVQSGKTLAMTTFSALAFDNGFRVVVVLTTNFLKLVKQTTERFEALDGPLVLSSTRIETWSEELDHVKRQIGRLGVVFVCAKDPQHLMTLVQVLKKLNADQHPAIILDDEADQATPDTATASRSRGAAPASSTVHRRIARNEVEPEQSIRETLPHNVFVQVTATPYALLLQNVGHPLRPLFTRLLEPGAGYTGGEAFFSADKVDSPAPPICFVDDEESRLILASDDEAPLGLEQAIAFFLLSAAAQQLLDRPPVGQNFLCHTSQKVVEHKRVAGIIRATLRRFEAELEGARQGLGATAIRFVEAYNELKKTLPDPPPLDRLIEDLERRLPRRNVFEINSNSDTDSYPRALNFLVGGNILGRGITIENLLVTYYLRAAKVSQMDTVLQHARMFGYRAPIMKYTRLYSPPSLIGRFAAIHEAEQSLRRLLESSDPSRPIAVVTPTALRATRANVLDTRSLSGIGPGQRFYVHPELADPKLSVSTERAIRALLSKLGPVAEGARACPLSELMQLVELVPYDESDGWPRSSIVAVLRSLEAFGRSDGLVYHVDTDRGFGTHRRYGGLNGAELARLSTPQAPTLALVFKSSARVLGASMLFPEDMPAHVFNTTEP